MIWEKLITIHLTHQLFYIYILFIIDEMIWFYAGRSNTNFAHNRWYADRMVRVVRFLVFTVNDFGTLIKIIEPLFYYLFLHCFFPHFLEGKRKGESITSLLYIYSPKIIHRFYKVLRMKLLHQNFKAIKKYL